MKIRIRKGLNNILISLGVISLLGNGRKVMGQTFYQCMPCKAGYYSDGSGGGCKACPRGTYSAHSISEKCTTCPEGQYTDSEGSTSCKACPKGHYCTGGHKYECDDGYYQNEEGKGECKVCSTDGFYVGFYTNRCRIGLNHPSWNYSRYNRWTCDSDLCPAIKDRKDWHRCYCAGTASNGSMDGLQVGHGETFYVYCRKTDGDRRFMVVKSDGTEEDRRSLN